MFWGLIMEPKRRYTQTVEKPFHISKAALDLYNCDEEATQLIITYNGRNYLLCTLQKDRVLQCSLNLNFNVGDTICFATNGKSNIHLSGFLVEQEFEEDDELSDDEEISTTVGKKRRAAALVEQPLKKSKTERLLDEVDEYDSADDTSFNLQEAEEEEGDSDLDEEDDEEGSDQDEDDEKEDEENEVESSLSESENEEETKVAGTKVPDPKPSSNGISLKETGKKKRRRKANQQPEQNAVAKLSKADTPKPDTPKPATPNKTPKNNQKNVTPQGPTAQKRTLEGGIIVQDLQVGDGALIKSGKMVQVYYEGRLKHNNKLFDSNKTGPGFKFRVGKQEVIKGWDVGLVGMKVGGKRRISCPPQMAYGQKGSPPVIPPNSTLIFEVEVKNVM